MTPEAFSKHLNGKWHGSYGCASCPICQQEGRTDQSALTIGGDSERLLLHCKKSGCDFKDILAAAGIEARAGRVEPETLLRYETQRREQAAQKLSRARSLWQQAQPIVGTPGEAYLRGRGITCDMPDSIRWLPDTYHAPSGQFCAAMIADVQASGGIHRTFFSKRMDRLTKSGKMMLGPCAGGAVRLSEASETLVVCEGIETGLSLLSGLLSGPASVWVSLSTSGMRALELPSKPGKLTIATDGDLAGRDAGTVLANRAASLGWKVTLLPAPEGRDWNDVLTAKGVAA